jgi:hypothetical protein
MEKKYLSRYRSNAILTIIPIFQYSNIPYRLGETVALKIDMLSICCRISETLIMRVVDLDYADAEQIASILRP